MIKFIAYSLQFIKIHSKNMWKLLVTANIYEVFGGELECFHQNILKTSEYTKNY